MRSVAHHFIESSRFQSHSYDVTTATAAAAATATATASGATQTLIRGAVVTQMRAVVKARHRCC